jgi:hypothetical protein
MADIKKPTTTSGSKRAATPAKSAVKAAVKSAVKPSAPVKKPAVAKPKVEASAKPVRSRAKKPTIGQEQRRNYIEVAAYYIAARRDFAPGDPLQDWIEAEAEIDRLLAEGRLGA